MFGEKRDTIKESKNRVKDPSPAFWPIYSTFANNLPHYCCFETYSVFVVLLPSWIFFIFFLAIKWRKLKMRHHGKLYTTRQLGQEEVGWRRERTRNQKRPKEWRRAKKRHQITQPTCCTGLRGAQSASCLKSNV